MNPQDTLELIKQRHSSRVPFDENRPVDPHVLDDILQAATWAPTAHNMQNFEIVTVRDKAVLTQLSELESATSPVFVQENYQQLSFTEDEWTAKGTGLLASQFPAAWQSEAAQAGQLREQPAPLGEQIRRGPVLMVLLYDPSRRAPASAGDFLGIMSLGCVLENMWLMATAHGLAFHIISPLANQPVASQIKQILGVPANLDITLSIRLGYPASPEEPRLRVRRQVADFATDDHFGATSD